MKFRKPHPAPVAHPRAVRLGEAMLKAAQRVREVPLTQPPFTALPCQETRSWIPWTDSARSSDALFFGAPKQISLNPSLSPQLSSNQRCNCRYLASTALRTQHFFLGLTHLLHKFRWELRDLQETLLTGRCHKNAGCQPKHQSQERRSLSLPTCPDVCEGNLQSPAACVNM